MKVALALLTIGAVTLAPVFAQAPDAPPVAIEACHVLTSTYYPFPGRADLPYVVTRGLEISYHMRAKSAAEVHFRANYRGEDAVITDAGSFATGTKITHQYNQFVNFAYLGTHPNACHAIFVRFTDGTTWNAPATRRQAAST